MSTNSDEKKKPKLIWNELSSKYDAPVKSINQLSSRLSEIFPKIQVCKYLERDEVDRRGQRYLLGVGFVQGSARTVKTSVPSVPVDTARDTAVPTSVPKNIGTDVGTNETLTQSGGTDGTNVSSPFAEVCNLLSQLNDDERQKLAEMLTQPKTVKAKKGLRVRYVGTKYAEQLAGLELVVDAIDKYRQITCVKPDGSFTTWLDPKDLEVAD